MEDVAWSDLYRRRREVNARYPSVFSLPKVRRAIRLATPRLVPGVRILEVGAGEHGRGRRLAEGIPDATCVSVDPDPTGEHDHARVEEVEGTFDVVLALELVEHLPLAEALSLLREVRKHLAPGGMFLLSTPNVFCPGRFLRDATHVTPFAWDELGGALILSGFRLTGLYRVVPGSLLRRLRHALVAPIGRAMGIDHAAPSIAAVATI